MCVGASATPVNTPSPADDWKLAFEMFLAAFAEERTDECDSQYVLYDLDADAVPELIIGSGTCEADYKYSLFRFHAETGAEFVVDFGYGHSKLCGLSAENALLIFGGHMGCEWADRLRWTGESFEQDRVMEERLLCENEEYLPFQGLSGCPIDSLDGLEWAGNPADENDVILAPARTENPQPEQ